MVASGRPPEMLSIRQYVDTAAVYQQKMSLPVDREPIRFLAGGNKILSARVDIDAARLPFGGEIRDEAGFGEVLKGESLLPHGCRR
jgi:hypothetical protein